MIEGSRKHGPFDLRFQLRDPANVVVSPESPPPSAEASAEADAENEGMPPRPESTSDRALLGQGVRR